MYYKLGQVCVTNLQVLFYYNQGQALLQIGASVVTNWGCYYKLWQPLLQNKATITNWGKMHYKLRQLL